MQTDKSDDNRQDCVDFNECAINDECNSASSTCLSTLGS